MLKLFRLKPTSNFLQFLKCAVSLKPVRCITRFIAKERLLLGVEKSTKGNTRTFQILSTVYCEAAEENKPTVDPSKDRSKVIPPETSILYLKSSAYKTTYGDEPVWVKYRRNFRGQFVPKKSRRTCIRGGVITTGSPCPICRDEYLVLHYTNIDLLKQFIDPETGLIMSTQKTHICQKRLLQLEVAVKKAKFYGLMTHEVPFREYNYKEYYPNWKE